MFPVECSVVFDFIKITSLVADINLQPKGNHKIMLIGLIKEHIEITTGICGGKPRIAGHRIKVQDIAICYERLSMSPMEIVSHYPSIGLADVHAALAYYYDHRVEINRQIEEGERLADEMRANTPSLLQQRLKEGYRLCL
jgi:uncharacterized protein (DUF433 family)